MFNMCGLSGSPDHPLTPLSIGSADFPTWLMSLCWRCCRAGTGPSVSAVPIRRKCFSLSAHLLFCVAQGSLDPIHPFCRAIWEIPPALFGTSGIFPVFPSWLREFSRLLCLDYSLHVKALLTVHKASPLLRSFHGSDCWFCQKTAFICIFYKLFIFYFTVNEMCSISLCYILKGFFFITLFSLHFMLVPHTSDIVYLRITTKLMC